MARVLPMCGVIKQLSSCHSGCSFGSGSGSVTSSVAPPMRRSRNAATKSSVTIKRPRPTFTSHASCFMSASSRAPIRPIVSGVSAQASTTASAWGNTSCNCAWVTTRCTPAIGAGWRRTTVMLVLKPCNMRTSDSVMPPPPTITMLPPNRYRPWSTVHSVTRE